MSEPSRTGDTREPAVTEVLVSALGPGATPPDLSELVLAAADAADREAGVVRIDTRDDTLVRVLTEHQRKDIGGCICGWGVDTGDLGRSHPRHVVDAVLAALGEATR
jgi:hypothetical protein